MMDLKKKKALTLFSKEIQLPPTQLTVSPLSGANESQFILYSSMGIQLLRLQPDMSGVRWEISVSSEVEAFPAPPL